MAWRGCDAMRVQGWPTWSQRTSHRRSRGYHHSWSERCWAIACAGFKNTLYLDPIFEILGPKHWVQNASTWPCSVRSQDFHPSSAPILELFRRSIGNTWTQYWDSPDPILGHDPILGKNFQYWVEVLPIFRGKSSNIGGGEGWKSCDLTEQGQVLAF